MLGQSAIRTFKQAKQYYLTTIFTLAMTLSMVLSVFSLADLVFFAPLPYDKSKNLYLLEGTIESTSYTGTGTNSQLITHLKNNNDVFTDLATYHRWTSYKLYDQVERPDVKVILASNNIFSLLGVKPELGRLFNQTEAYGAKQTSVILGYRTWQKYYKGDSNIVGRKVQLNQRRFTVIGVAPDDLVLAQYADINNAFWIPIDMDETFDPKTAGGFMGGFKSLIRLKENVDLATVNEQIKSRTIEGAELYTPYILKDFKVGAQVTRLDNALQGDSGSIVLMLLAGVTLLLIIALTNLSSMQLAKAIAKVKNVAISFAFGASRKQLLIESFKHNILVIGLAIILALLLTNVGFSVIKELASDSIQRLDTLTLSMNTWLFSGVLALLIALLYSYIELSAVKEENLTDSLQSSGKGVGKQMGTGTSHILIGLQVMFSFIVLIASSHVALMTLSEALRDNGIDTDNKWSLTINYSNLKTATERENTHKSILNQLSQLPSLANVEIASEPRLPQNLNTEQLYNESNQYLAQIRTIDISLGYMESFDLALRGSAFQPGDSELANYPVIINQRLADAIANNPEDVIGTRVSKDGKSFHTVVGIASNTYVPGALHLETYDMYTPRRYDGRRQYSFLLESVDDQVLEHQVRELISKVDTRLDIKELSTVKHQFDEMRKRHLTSAWIAIVLASISLSMVCVGINGIVNYMVQVRRYSLGVKLAMGANYSRLLKDSLLELMKPTVMSLVFAFSISFLLIGYSNTQPDIHFFPDWLMIAYIWFGFCILLLVVSFFPVQKILARDPIKALRNE